MANLLAQLITGNAAVFEEVYKLYHTKIYRFALKFVKDQEFALEITQQAFVKLWEKRDSLQSHIPLEGQLFVLTRNLIIDNLRKQARDKKLLETHFGQRVQTTTENTEHSVLFSDFQQKAQKLIEAMPSRRQEIYRLNKEQGLSIDEIAKQLSISPKTVDTQLQLAMKYLRSKIPHFLHSLLF